MATQSSEPIMPLQTASFPNITGVRRMMGAVKTKARQIATRSACFVLCVARKYPEKLLFPGDRTRPVRVYSAPGYGMSISGGSGEENV